MDYENFYFPDFSTSRTSVRIHTSYPMGQSGIVGLIPLQAADPKEVIMNNAALGKQKFRHSSVSICSSSWSRIQSIIKLLGILLLLTAITGCPPIQYGDPLRDGIDQCPDINVTSTDEKDISYASMPTIVDSIVMAFLNDQDDPNDPNDAVGPPGCAIGIMDNNVITHVKGYGYADLRGKSPIQCDNDGDCIPFTRMTSSLVGSVAKTLTALAVLRLTEYDPPLIKLDDTIADHLSDFPLREDWKNITIRQLLSHTSDLIRDPNFKDSINDELSLKLFFVQTPTGPVLSHPGIYPSAVLPTFLKDTGTKPFTDPATARYSNVGYMILGAIIERTVAKNPDVVGPNSGNYERFIWKHVGLGGESPFIGFGNNHPYNKHMLSHCLYEGWREQDIHGLAKGYEWNGFNRYIETNVVQANDEGPSGWWGPAGGWTMRISDLVRLMMGIQNNTIIKKATRDNEMMMSYGTSYDFNTNPPLPNLTFGLGATIDKVCQDTGENLDVWRHDGVIEGYHARWTVWPREDVGVAVMCNETNAKIGDLTKNIADALWFSGNKICPKTENNGEVPKIGASVSIDPTLPLISQQTKNAIITGERQQMTEINSRKSLENLGCMILLEDLLGNPDSERSEALSECAENSTNHGEYAKCVSHLTNDLQQAWKISGKDKGTLQQCAAQMEGL